MYIATLGELKTALEIGRCHVGRVELYSRLGVATLDELNTAHEIERLGMCGAAGQALEGIIRR